jgi:alkylation response protein AidB-like acyl-CoA dehydrogenase
LKGLNGHEGKMSFNAPLRDIRFTLNDVVGLKSLDRTGAFDDLSDEIIDAVLGEAARVATEVVAPLNVIGDQQGSQLVDGVVKTPDGFAAAYQTLSEGGWMGVPFDPAYGGQGLPKALGLAVQEMWTDACLAFSLCPLLSRGAIEAIGAHGTEEQKKLYLEKLISGQWTGTMNLTEPQAGSDVGALTTKAAPAGDGTYKITGTKIFISWGDHDLTENIVHLVLARLPDAPAGTRGISLFIVPKFLTDDDGSIGALNDLKCASLEHKLGIHASPTCVMSFGDNDRAIGYLLGEENRGMACMFTMMNDARLGVGLEGLGIAERAYQQALAYSQERRQGKPPGKQHDDVASMAIIEHADVRRMLYTMKSHIEGMRGVCYATAMALDEGVTLKNENERLAAKARADLLTPIAKGWCTDLGMEVASIALQVHGGMGYIEETGAAQHFRDSRIPPIYEGTNGIQAIDLVTRKLPLGNGKVVQALMDEIVGVADQAKTDGSVDLAEIGAALSDAAEVLGDVAKDLQSQLKSNSSDALSGATAFLRLFGNVTAGFYLAKGALAAQARLSDGDPDEAFLTARIGLARFFARDVLPMTLGLAAAAKGQGDLLFALSPEQLGP